MALEFMLSLLILLFQLQIYFLLIILKYMLMYITKGYPQKVKKVTDKVDAPISVDAVATALYPLISELRGRHSQRQMATRFSCSPNLSKCQAFDCH